jgi:hypothetical protein
MILQFLLLVFIGLLLVRGEVFMDIWLWGKDRDDKPITELIRAALTLIIAGAFRELFDIELWKSCLVIIGVYMWFDNILNHYRGLDWRYHPPKNRWERFWGGLNNFTYIILRSLILIISCVLFFLL